MSGVASSNQLLRKNNHTLYRDFILNPEQDSLTVPIISDWATIINLKRKRQFTKTQVYPSPEIKNTPLNANAHSIQEVLKDGEHHSLLWHTDGATLKKACRWGIIKTQSVTGKVISALGQYRVVGHERIAKGMISNSQAIKFKLLDLYQDRFEALRQLESLVNKRLSMDVYEIVFKNYDEMLEKITSELSDNHFGTMYQKGLDKEITIQQIREDITADRKRAQDYLESLRLATDKKPYQRARGEKSILEFVKQQMMHGLYELQGINQDLTYSTEKRFALTRGRLNDVIEDARREIDEHEADLRNAITAKHQGIFAEDKALVTYDFSTEISPAREREVMLAVSFIEGWDQVHYNDKEKRFVVINSKQEEEPLDEITATNWQNHRSIKALILYAGDRLFNMIKSFLLKTRPQEEEAWENKQFHLTATALREHTKYNEPMWRKPFTFFKRVIYALIDFIYGMRDVGVKLVVQLPAHFKKDWDSTKKMAAMDETLEKLRAVLEDIQEKEARKLAEHLKKFPFINTLPGTPNRQLAVAEYTLTTNEQNDILTAMARGLNGFTGFFTHNIYAKDPLAGLLFTAGYAIGASVIFFPTFAASLFGPGYVNMFTNASYGMGSSKITATIAGGSTQGQLFSSLSDLILHGPNSMLVDAGFQFIEDPLTVSAYGLAAYWIGAFLVNGIAGHPIPGLSEFFREDLGTAPESGYPLIGGKVAVALYEMLITHPKQAEWPPELQISQKELEQFREMVALHRKTDHEFAKAWDQLQLALFLVSNREHLNKLDAHQAFELSRHIDCLFSKEESAALNKLIRPEKNHSIAFQLFSIPLSYIPMVLRLVFSPLISFVAWLDQKEKPLNPMKRSASDLLEKVRKDLSRLLLFTTQVTYMVYHCVSAVLKSLVYVAQMAVARVTSLLGKGVGHSAYSSFASIHIASRKVGETLYPARAVKSVVSAHPTHVLTAKMPDYYALLQAKHGLYKSKAQEQPADALVANASGSLPQP